MSRLGCRLFDYAPTCLCVAPALLSAQGLNPATLVKPLSDSWPTYSGDYSGRRYSALTHINQSNRAID